MFHKPGLKHACGYFYGGLCCLWWNNGRQVRNVSVKWATMTPIVSYEIGAGIIENMVYIM